MKYSFFILVFFQSIVSICAQDEQSRSLGDFSEIKVYDRLHIKLIPSEKNSVELSGSNLEDVQLVNKNGLLKVKMNAGETFNDDETFIKIYYKNLNLIDANEGSKVTVEDTISQDIELKVQEGAEIHANLNVKNVHMRAVTGGILNLLGSADYQEVKISTGGVYKGKSLKTAVSEIRIQAGGEAEAFATDLAKLTVRAGGDIYMYGNPRNVEQTKFVAGSIKIMP